MVLHRDPSREINECHSSDDDFETLYFILRELEFLSLRLLLFSLNKP